ncbi:MAG TPA: response regulator transcription factor [Roseiflexaceae bacterium]|nr:response regulator transcription factor [Roseiflexaceae bacterium]
MEDQQPAIRVLLVDDHRMVRYGIRAMLSLSPDIVVVGEAADGEEALACCHEQRPDVILMDVTMPQMDGPTATARIRAAFPQIQVIALTSFVDETLVLRALQAGAISYLLKDVHDRPLVEAIRAAYRGRATFSPLVAQTLAQRAATPSAPRPVLTKREHEVLALLEMGQTNQAIAEQLQISSSTVHLHVSNLLAKLGASNRTEAVMLARQHKLIP